MQNNPILKEELKVLKSSDLLEHCITTRDLIYNRRLLSRSISGLPVPIITITARKNKGFDYKKRQAICITARVHPGETNSNFVFDGFLNFLMTNEGS